MTSDEENEEEIVENPHVHAYLGEKHKRLLNQLANSHHGGNKTTCLRMALKIFEQWHQKDGEQKQWSDQARQELAEQTEILQTLLEGQEELEDRISELQSESPLPQDIGLEVTNEAADNIYSILKNVDHPLSVDGLLERSNLSLTALGKGLETLLDNSIVEETAKDGDIPRYRIIGANYDK